MLDPKNFFFGKSMALSVDGQPPMEIQAGRFGEPIWTPSGILDLTAEMADGLIRNMPPTIEGYIGYEHLILEEVEAPAAGWFLRLENRGEGEDGGLWAIVKNWTPRAQKAIQDKEYKYLSMVINPDGRHWQTGEPIGPVLHSIGLTGTPRWKNQRPLVNKDGQTKEEAAMIEGLRKLLALKDDATEKDVTAAIQELQKRPEKATLAAKEVLEALSLKEEATLEDIQGAVKALKEAGEKAKKAAKEKDPDPERYVLKADHETTVKSLKEVQEKLDTVEATKLVDDEMHSSKGSRITGAERDWAIGYAMKDRKGFDEWLEKTPVKIPAGKIAMKEKPGLKDVPDEVQAKINKQLGISKETWEKRQKEDEE